jgi:hypothetical protein
MSRTERGLAVLLGVVALAVAVLRLRGAHFEWMLWSDRDLVRSATFTTDWPTTGPELSHGIGARLPGWAYHALLAVPLAFSPDPLVAWRWQALLDSAGMLALAWAVARVGGPLAGAATACAWLTAEGLDDSVAKLWNPGFLPAFLGVATAAWVRAVGEGRGRALGVSGVAVGLAAQQHASAGLAAVAMLPAVLAVRPPGWGRGLVLGVAGFVATYLPHLADEAMRGWPNTSALLEQSYVRAPRETFSARHAAAHAAVLLRGLVVDPGLPVRGLETAARWGGLASGLVVGLTASVAAAGAVRRRDGADRVVLGAAVGLGLAAGYVASDSRLDLTGYGGFRYMLFAVPGFAAWVGLAARGPLRLALVAALLVSSGIVGTRCAVLVPPRDGYASLREVMDVVGRELGVAPLDGVGRTAFVNGDDPRTFHLQQDDGVDYLLGLEGRTWPGSRSGPCAFVFARSLPASLRDGDAVAPDAVDRILARVPHPPATLVRAVPYRNVQILIVDLGPMRCPTTFPDRYLPTPIELAAWQAVEGAADATAVPLDGGGWAVGLDVRSRDERVDGRVALAIRLEPGAGSLTARLDSNQLRGKAYNQGFYVDGLIGHPVVVLRRGDAVVEVPLAWDLVGIQAESPPIAATAPVPAGRWDAELHVETLVGWLARDADLTMLVREPRVVPLGPVEVGP